MPAEVETMMSVREIPWHGLGTILDEAPTGTEALVAAGLDWNVELRPVYYKNDGDFSEFEKSVLVVRDSDEQPLGIVGRNYKPIQNDEMFAFCDALLDTGDVVFETAGALKNGALVWALARIDRPVVVAGDETIPYLLVSNGHDGWNSFAARTTPTRVVCANTLQIAYRNARSKWSIRHTGDPVAKLDEARTTLGLSFDYYDQFESDVRLLIDTEVTRHRFNSIVSRLIPKGETERSEAIRSEQRDEIRALYESETVQPFTDTGWGVVNAVSEWELWGKKSRSKRSRSEVQADRIFANDATPLTQRAHSMLVGKS